MYRDHDVILKLGEFSLCSPLNAWSVHVVCEIDLYKIEKYFFIVKLSSRSLINKSIYFFDAVNIYYFLCESEFRNVCLRNLLDSLDCVSWKFLGQSGLCVLEISGPVQEWFRYACPRNFLASTRLSIVAVKLEQ